MFAPFGKLSQEIVHNFLSAFIVTILNYSLSLIPVVYLPLRTVLSLISGINTLDTKNDYRLISSYGITTEFNILKEKRK